MHTILINPDGAFDIVFVMPNGEYNVLTTRNDLETAASFVSMLNGGLSPAVERHLDKFLLDTLGLIATERDNQMLNR